MTTVLVTGATDGIGLRTVQDLSALGADVIVHGRDAGRVERCVAGIEGTARGVVADFTCLDEVRAIAEELADGPLDVLINNAGTFQQERRVTRDGHEVTWQVNHLAGAFLADLLLDALADRNGRIVFVSAAMYARADMDLADPDYAGRPYDGQQAYGQSKLANVMYMNELVRRLGPQPPVTVNALHPGVVGTKLLEAAFGSVPQQSLEEGAASVVRLAVDDALAQTTGAFFIGDRPRAITGPAADAAASRRLYELTCAQLAVPGLPVRQA